MTDRYTQFFTELAELLERHKVTMEAREGSSSWAEWADGVDFDFEFLPYEEGERAADADSRTVEMGRYIDADDCVKEAKKVSEDG